MTPLRILLVILSLVVGATSPAQPYDIAPIEGIQDFEAWSLSPTGFVVGYAPIGGVNHGVLWRPEQTTVLSNGGFEQTFATAANTSGVIVGQLANSSTGHACRWDSASSAPVDLGSVAGADHDSSANAINETGNFVGGTDVFDEQSNLIRHPFLYRNGAMIDLGEPQLPFTSYIGTALAINDSDQVVGYFFDSEGMHYRAFLWDNSGGMRLLANAWVAATDINNGGVIVGTQQDFPGSGVYSAFRYFNGGFHNLGDGARAYKVNNGGDIVGRSAGFRGILWRDLVPMQLDTMLTEPGWTIESARDINDAGQILVSAYRNETPFQYRYALLTPVPEPSTLFALAFGILSLAIARRRLLRG